MRSFVGLEPFAGLPVEYALVSKIVRAQPLRRLVRPLLITCFGTAFAGAASWSVAGMIAMGSSLALSSGQYMPKPQFYPAKRMQARLSGGQALPAKSPRLAAASVQPFVTGSIAAPHDKAADHNDVAKAADASSNAARFEDIVKKAGLTPEKLASLFGNSGSAKSTRPAAKIAAPAPQYATSQPAAPAGPPQTVLAYADPSPSGAAGAALSALLAAPSEEDLAAEDLDLDDATAMLPGFEDTPLDSPLPQPRPLGNQSGKADAETQQPGASKPDEPKKADGSEAQKPQQLAYARPDDPSEKRSRGLGQTLQNLFGGRPKTGGVAVYDISAAKVYMPDGSVLEAHSGIGKMADDPRYAHVKMNGPTPPHTYNLRMRESRFHGVEAIRMLPVDGKNKHGRDGFLTHSYLLRGKQAQSHGCVAFKDYDRFLTAFKQGKVKQMIVVPSGGQETMRIASNGNRV